ncbi:periplasmic heavy metal sensor [Phaeobacter sp.]|uniref:periplasmic heavy metal sensor n=1 Tax=Phaeobacter sp. TaxID=1902409 RepID=UPI0025EB5C97|nr:periplasmic heavy metal sensor [Phaeobacter sp.]
MTPSDHTKPPKRWLRWVLIGSLAFNLIVVGVVVGALWRFSGHGGSGFRAQAPLGALIFRDLDRETRKALRQQAEAGHDSYHARRAAEGMRVLQLLRQEPFDSAPLVQVLAEHSEQRHGFHRSVQVAWLQQIEAMSPQERAAYADDLEARMARGRNKGWRP